MKALLRRLSAASLLLALSSFVSAATPSITGLWEGTALFRGHDIPLRLQITGSPSALHAALLNGVERSPASSATFQNGKLLLNFNYFARTLEATLVDGQLSGTFGSTSTGPHSTPRMPITLHRATAASTSAAGPDIHGDWEVAVSSAKGETAWQLLIEPAQRADTPAAIRAVIQRIDGDTGSLYGSWDGHRYLVSHFTASGPALYSFTPQPNGTLLVSNLIPTEAQKDRSTNLVARRPAEARRENLPPPTESTQQTRMKDPSAPLTFSFPDLSGQQVSSSDARFRNKVVIVAIGGSWCPNCHDEAPLLQSLYKQFHSRGLEIVSLSFEEEDQLHNPTRLRAFIQRYGITYPVLIAGTPDDLNQKLPQAEDLNSWPTSFFIGRDGRVREIHAGFAGPANPPAHQALEREVTALVEKLLAEPSPTRKASF
ncbi:MAG TPA: TlpA disulfide reductase family protein [Edaphobacter sp.]|nr:TlpA disulfide reductase family protein [Edaphobacter sp.]